MGFSKMKELDELDTKRFRQKWYCPFCKARKRENCICSN